MMKRSIFRGVLFSLLVLLFATGTGYGLAGQGAAKPAEETVASDPTSVNPARGYKDGELLVKFKPGVHSTSKEDLHGKVGARKIKEFKRLRIHHLGLPKGMRIADAIRKYKADPRVEYAEPNYIVSIENTPDDALFDDLWNLHNTGQTEGLPDADIDAPEAWNITTGADDIVVAVIDTGVDYSHEDLADNMWTNPLEIPGNGIDDDGNGYVDDLYGIDTYFGDGDPADDYGHGTHVAGIIGAKGDNGIGVAGVNWNVKIMACKFLGPSGSGYTADAVECLEYIREMKDYGVNVVATNNSWGGGAYSQALYDAINDQGDILFMASAGNSGSDNDYTPEYPSGYSLPNIIAVAATDHQDQLSSFSSFGAKTVDVGAPGEDVLSTLPDQNVWGIQDGYGYLSGTSMAAPHVTGLAALIKAAAPERDWVEIKNRILCGGDSLSSLSGKTLSGRRINAASSLTCTDASVLSVLEVPCSVQVGTPTTLSALSINCDSSIGPVTVTPEGEGSILLHDDGVEPDLFSGDGIFAGEWTPSHEVASLVFSSPAGNETFYFSTFGISTQYLSEAYTDHAYSLFLKAKGGTPPYSWSVVNGTSLPPGLSLNASTGELYGTPLLEGSTSLSIRVMDATQTSDIKWFTLKVGSETEDFPVEEWLHTYGSECNDYGKDIAVDQGGNILTTGYSWNDGNYDFQTIKYDPDGNLLWSVRHDGGYTDKARGIAVDAAGNVYVAGETYGAASLNDYLLIKYDAAGNLQWTRTYDGGGDDNAKDVAVSAAGVTVTGYSSIDHYFHILTIQYDFDGNVIWTRQYDYGTHDYAIGLAVDGAGNILITGNTYYDSSYYALTLKYSSSGSLIWSKTMEGSAYGIAADDAGNVYIAGNDSISSFAVKYSPAGSELWTRYYGGGNIDVGRAVDVDGYGNVYVAGSTTSYSSQRPFVVGYDADGNLLWSKTYNTGNSRSGTYSGIAVDENNNIYCGGDSLNNFFTIKYHMPLVITDTTLPEAPVNKAYLHKLRASGGTPPHNWSVIAGSLPPGLNLDEASGEISGLPTATGTFSFTVQVVDAESSVTAKELAIKVIPPVYETWRRVFVQGWLAQSKAIALDSSANVYVAGRDYSLGALIIKYDPQGEILWNKGLYEGEIYGLAVDPEDNCYAVSETYSAEGQDNYIAYKYDPDGNLLWSRTYDSGDTDFPKSIAVDSDGNSYITGCTGSFSLAHIMTAKYDPDGNLEWVKDGGGASACGYDVAVDGDNNIYVAGTKNLQWALLKYDRDGNEIWTQSGPGGYSAFSIAIDEFTNIYLTGNSSSRYRTVKYDANGNILWETTEEDIGTAQGIAVDAAGYVYVTGYMQNAAQNNDYATIKYDPQGATEWKMTFDGGYDDEAHDIAVDASGNIYVTGDSFVGDYSSDATALTIRYGQSPLLISTAALADAIVGTDYAQTLAATGGLAPYSWTLIAGNLPTGLNLDGATGEIAGVPQAAGAYDFTVQVTDAISFVDEQPLSLSVFEYESLDVAVSGSGTVVSAPQGINCPGDCSESYLQGTEVTLTPSAADGWFFSGWSGDCTGTGPCQLIMGTDLAVNAAFYQPPVTADFSATPVTGGAPHRVLFTDLSANTPVSWLWDFGDGTMSTEENPSHIYEAPGVFTVTLQVNNDSSSDIESKTNYITVDSSCPLLPAKNGMDYYSTIQDAYDHAISGSDIDVQAGVYTGDLLFNDPGGMSIRLRGGWDCIFGENSATTKIDGKVTISRGTLVVEQIFIQ